MPYPYTFANVTSISSVWWDNNFNAIGAVAPNPATVAGSNALTLTPLSSAPSVTAYAPYQTYVGIAIADNTGPVSAAVGSLPVLPVYKDTEGGPVALIGGEIIEGNAIFLTYDLALNSGGGGFHLGTGPAQLVGAYLPLSGGTLTGKLAVPTLSVPGASATSITRVNSTSASLSFSSLSPGGSQDQTISLAGCSIGDVVSLGYPSSLQAGIGYTGFVSGAGAVTVRAFNFTPTSTLTPTGGTYRAAVEGFT